MSYVVFVLNKKKSNVLIFNHILKKLFFQKDIFIYKNTRLILLFSCTSYLVFVLFGVRLKKTKKIEKLVC